MTAHQPSSAMPVDRFIRQDYASILKATRHMLMTDDNVYDINDSDTGSWRHYGFEACGHEDSRFIAGCLASIGGRND